MTNDEARMTKGPVAKSRRVTPLAEKKTEFDIGSFDIDSSFGLRHSSFSSRAGSC